MDQEKLKDEMRLWALECVVSQLYVMFYSATGNPTTALETRRQTLLNVARNTTFPGFDPAMSDLASAELESAVERLMQMQKSILDGSS